MALLIKCPNCQKDVSGMASRCPFCNTDLTHVHDNTSENQNQNHTYFNPDSGPAIHYPDFPEKNKQTHTLSHSANPSVLKSSTVSERTAAPQTTAEEDSKKNNREGEEQTEPVVKRRRKSPPAGRRLLGYRSGNLLCMFFSVFYHMAACIGILYAFSLSPQYMADGTLIFHLCRVILAAFMLFLPVLLLSETKLRRKFPLFRSRKPAALALGFLILYIPLAILFFAACCFCTK
ncbi:MAG: hypothetical protein SO101_11115 [Lachnospiraceae bacterium]|nr:hypothetical protein [Lachnospiraceae bacterium]